MSDRYVILTGAKNNAGDYLIKHRALQLFAALRPDREIVEFDGWLPLDENQLETINSSRALILTGGPALQPRMYPGIYPLVNDLDRIKVPVVSMAIGWKGARASRSCCSDYRLTGDTVRLLRKIASSGYNSSVRDYHTLRVLQRYGFDNFVVTGCAALYSLEHLGRGLKPGGPLERISFTPGVAFARDEQQAGRLREIVAMLRSAFPQAVLTAVFHHSVNAAHYRQTHNPNLRLVDAQQRLQAWLEREGVAWVDVSGGVEKMLNHYQQCDLHVGYRVHAHILMASMARPTVLIAEDGRGGALREVLGGLIVEEELENSSNLLSRLLSRLGKAGRNLLPAAELVREVVQQVEYEQKHGYPRISSQCMSMEKHFQIMKSYLEGLP